MAVVVTCQSWCYVVYYYYYCVKSVLNVIMRCTKCHHVIVI